MALLGFLSTDLHRLRRFFGASLGFWERQGEFLIFMKFHVFHGFIQIGVAIAIAIGIDCLTTGHFLGFHGFRFQGFMVSSKSGSGSVSVSGSIISPRDAFLGFGVSRFHGFIQIGVAIAIGIGIAIGIAIGIDFPDTWS